MTRPLAVIALSAAVAAVLSGCALVNPSNAEEQLTGIETCALGRVWKLDTESLATAVQDLLVKGGVAGAVVKADGSQTMTWDLDGHVKLDTDYTLTVTSAPAADQTLVVTDKHSGVATGISYINSEVAIPRDWDATGLTRTSTAKLNDEAVDPVPYALISTDLDDSVGVELTCDGGNLTTHQRGTELTLKWKS